VAHSRKLDGHLSPCGGVPRLGGDLFVEDGQNRILVGTSVVDGDAVEPHIQISKPQVQHGIGAREEFLVRFDLPQADTSREEARLLGTPIGHDAELGCFGLPPVAIDAGVFTFKSDVSAAFIPYEIRIVAPEVDKEIVVRRDEDLSIRFPCRPFRQAAEAVACEQVLAWPQSA